MNGCTIFGLLSTILVQNFCCVPILRDYLYKAEFNAMPHHQTDTCVWQIDTINWTFMEYRIFYFLSSIWMRKFGPSGTYFGSLVSNYCLNMSAPRTAGLSLLVSFVAWPGVYTAGVHPDPGRLVSRYGRLTWLLAYLCTGQCYIMCTYSIKEKKVLSCLFSHLYLYDTR